MEWLARNFASRLAGGLRGIVDLLLIREHSCAIRANSWLIAFAEIIQRHTV
jgi:hypothetical protein